MFTEKQIQDLSAPLDKKTVKTRQQGGRDLSYIEAWHAIAEANRIFGFDGWARETVYCKEVSRVECVIGQYKKPGFKVGYEAKVRITVGDTVREGTGHGCGTMSDLFDCIESAAKEAESDAMKRALMTFGNQFGLALYDKLQRGVEDVEPKAREINVEPEYNIHVDEIKKCTSKAEFVQLWNSPEAKEVRAKIKDHRADLYAELNVIKDRLLAEYKEAENKLLGEFNAA